MAHASPYRAITYYERQSSDSSNKRVLCSHAQLRAEMAAAQQPRFRDSQQASTDRHAEKVCAFRYIMSNLVKISDLDIRSPTPVLEYWTEL